MKNTGNKRPNRLSEDACLFLVINTTTSISTDLDSQCQGFDQKFQETQKIASKITRCEEIKQSTESDQDAGPDTGTIRTIINTLKDLWKRWGKMHESMRNFSREMGSTKKKRLNGNARNKKQGIRDEEFFYLAYQQTGQS